MLVYWQAAYHTIQFCYILLFYCYSQLTLATVQSPTIITESTIITRFAEPTIIQPSRNLRVEQPLYQQCDTCFRKIFPSHTPIIPLIVEYLTGDLNYEHYNLGDFISDFQILTQLTANQGDLIFYLLGRAVQAGRTPIIGFFAQPQVWQNLAELLPAYQQSGQLIIQTLFTQFVFRVYNNQPQYRLAQYQALITQATESYYPFNIQHKTPNTPTITLADFAKAYRSDYYNIELLQLLILEYNFHQQQLAQQAVRTNKRPSRRSAVALTPLLATLVAYACEQNNEELLINLYSYAPLICLELSLPVINPSTLLSLIKQFPQLPTQFCNNQQEKLVDLVVQKLRPELMEKLWQNKILLVPAKVNHATAWDALVKLLWCKLNEAAPFPQLANALELVELFLLHQQNRSHQPRIVQQQLLRSIANQIIPAYQLKQIQLQPSVLEFFLAIFLPNPSIQQPSTIQLTEISRSRSKITNQPS